MHDSDHRKGLRKVIVVWCVSSAFIFNKDKDTFIF